MAGPIGYGIGDGMRRARRHEGSRRPSPPSPAESWTAFVVLTIALSWITAAAIGTGLQIEAQSRIVRSFWASLYYAAVMGWQPLLGSWLARWAYRGAATKAGLLSSKRIPDYVLAVGGATGLATIAMVIARVQGEPMLVGTTDAPVGVDGAAASVGVFLVLCVQAVTEEYGWRGSPLGWAIDRWGARAGLVIHGLAWGAWYAPLFIVTATDPSTSVAAAGRFVLTCILLGIALGWLRLRTGSILPPAIANAVLTLMAGLPLLLASGSSGARDAVFRWPGWLALGVLALLILVFGKFHSRHHPTEP
jgi:membrane protease YdiL (CAAX protease family)